MTKLFWYSFLNLVQLSFFLQPPQKRLLNHFKKIKDEVHFVKERLWRGIAGRNSNKIDFLIWIFNLKLHFWMDSNFVPRDV